MRMTDKVGIPEQVLARKVGEETVILDLASGTYFGLNPVGARIWELMTEGRTLSEICIVMLNEYEVLPEDLERDVFNLAEELSAKGLISVA